MNLSMVFATIQDVDWNQFFGALLKIWKIIQFNHNLFKASHHYNFIEGEGQGEEIDIGLRVQE